MRLTADEWMVAKAVCTTQQLRALNLWRHGYGKKAIGDAMCIDPSTAQQHVRSGKKNIAEALEGLAA